MTKQDNKRTKECSSSEGGADKSRFFVNGLGEQNDEKR